MIQGVGGRLLSVCGWGVFHLMYVCAKNFIVLVFVFIPESAIIWRHC